MDHPRIRGEHGRESDHGDFVEGSSPHTRGALSTRWWRRRRRRIIPAYAGSTFPRVEGAGLDGDHPRIRGEHRVWLWRPPTSRGSSPHTRGALVTENLAARRARIIPAYAGSTPSGVRPRWAYWDHPRIRGEHRPRGLRSTPGPGSSPHTRGAREGRLGWGVPCWIIPAYAGSTSPDEAIPMKSGDHPRIRGEHGIDILGRRVAKGSSPHTRGAQLRVVSLPVGVGIIPAYAGSTEVIVYPVEFVGGSSPHTRGARR